MHLLVHIKWEMYNCNVSLLLFIFILNLFCKEALCYYSNYLRIFFKYEEIKREIIWLYNI